MKNYFYNSSSKYKKNKKNLISRKFILVTVGFLLFLIIFFSTSVVSSRKSLKALAMPNTKIGSIGAYQTIFPENNASQQQYRKLYERELNAVTVLSYPKGIWTGFKQYDFSQFNATVNWFENEGFVQIAHLLVGPNHYYPEWFSNTAYKNQELEGILEDYIRAVMQSNNNGSKIDIWNVINETMWLEGGAPYAGTIWNQLGWEEDRSGLTGADKILSNHPVYIRKALKIARKYTKNKLELRDNGIEFPSDDEYQMFYQLVRHLLNEKVPLDAVGFQTHLTVDHTYDWEGLKNNIKRYKDLGLEVYITEFDVGNDGTEEGRNKQKEYYYNAVKAIREGGADIINLWGLRDGQMGDYREDEFALMFEGSNMNPKPAYFGFKEALIDSR
jgi:GH35 family endo-1,4-beta-xylanase